MDIIQKKIKIIAFLFGIIGILSLSNLNTISGQEFNYEFQVPEYYAINEYSQINDTLYVQEQIISIPLHSERWTVTDLMLNLSGLELEREIVPIEINGTNTDTLKNKKNYQAYAVEIDLPEPTIIYGVELYGAKLTGDDPVPPIVQIQGFDGSNLPNGTVLAETALNMSQLVGWYQQIFSTPVSLPIGKYYLVIDGFDTLVNSEYLLWYNDFDPANPSLHTSYLSTFIGFPYWTAAQTGRPYRYKIIQKVERLYDPEEIDMNATIGVIDYPIINGPVSGSGILNVSSISIEPMSEFLSIAVSVNISATVAFSVDFLVDLENQFLSEGRVTIQNDSFIEWIINPDFERLSSHNNYYVQIQYPSAWFNVQIFRNGINVTSEIDLNSTTNIITIHNETIQHDSEINIQAISTATPFDLTIQKTEYEPLQLIQLSVGTPSQTGNLTFLFVDPNGIPMFKETKVVSSENVFSYQIPQNPVEDSYHAVIFWNNQTHAGIEIQQYDIIVPFSLTEFQLIAIVSASVTIPLFGVVTVVGIRKSNRKKEAARQKILNKYQDVLHLDHIIIADKKTGLDIYDESISGKGMSATLITGFLEAIRSFGIELTNSEKESQTIKLEYQNSKILMSEFKNLRTTLIMTENPSQDFVDSVKNLSEEIEAKFRENLENFKGNTTAFKSLNYFIAKHLNTSLIYPLKLNITRKTRLTSDQKSVIKKIKSVMKQNDSDYFYVSQLFSEKKGFQLGWGVSILKLIDKGVFIQKK